MTTTPKTTPRILVDDSKSSLFYEKLNEWDWLYLVSHSVKLDSELLEKLNQPTMDWWFDWYLAIFPMAETEWKAKLENKELDWYAYYCLSKNNNDITIDLLIDHDNWETKRIKWRINWDALSLNPHPKAIQLLIKNPECINWGYFSRNPSSEVLAMYLANPEKIHVTDLFRNPNYELIKNKELTNAMNNVKRVKR
jgi:hypothetical protein